MADTVTTLGGLTGWLVPGGVEALSLPFASVLVVVGIAALLIGGDLFVRGAAALAKRLGIGPLVIGLTLVAFGTSAPELAVNVLAAATDRGAISFGNIIGSNMANIGLILGIAALIKPLVVGRSLVAREIPMMLLATAVVLVMSFDVHLGGEAAAAGGTGTIVRGDGLILLLLFAVFMYYQINEVVGDRDASAALPDIEEVEQEPERPVPLAATLTLAGGLAVAAGGDVTVDAASEIARQIGVSEGVIGLTVVAAGTSLPELATSLAALRRGQTEIAIGNVVGSNIFNLLLVLGVTATVRPIPVPAGGNTDLLLVAALSVALFPFASLGQRNLKRPEGVALLIAYVGYVVWRGMNEVGAG